MQLQESMRMKLNYRIVIFALAIVFGIFFSIPSLLQTEGGKKVTLGLDLQGGLHMLLGVKTEEAVKSRMKSIAASIKHYTQRKDILIDSLKFTDESISFLASFTIELNPCINSKEPIYLSSLKTLPLSNSPCQQALRQHFCKLKYLSASRF